MATRIGTAPADRSEIGTCANHGCPDVLRVDDQDALDVAEVQGMPEGPVYAVIGTLATAKQLQQLSLPEGAGVADHEVMVFIPEKVLLQAAEDLLARRASAPAVAQ